MDRRLLLVLVGGFTLACGGGTEAAPVASAPMYGSVAFQTYEYDGTWMKFNTDTKVSTSWRNSACSALNGTYTQEGETITVHFEDPENCNGWDDMKLKQVSDCSMAAYWWKDPTSGEVKEDDSWMFERTEPSCPHR